MTKQDTKVFESMKKTYHLQSNGDTPIDDLCFPQLNSDTSTISNVTRGLNHYTNEAIIPLNYSFVNSAMVLETIW